MCRDKQQKSTKYTGILKKNFNVSFWNKFENLHSKTTLTVAISIRNFVVSKSNYSANSARSQWPQRGADNGNLIQPSPDH